ncbi:MAG: hypothetical protein HN602_12920 [Gammaproteobacteria bacterium]|nr:hypothetical protein [Gammaproteobacteria bacterium]
MNQFSLMDISSAENEKLNPGAAKIRAEAERRKAERVQQFEDEQRNASGLQPASAFGMGAVGTIKSLGSGLKYVGAESLGETIESWGEETNQEIYEDLSDDSREALNTPLTVEDEGSMTGAGVNPEAGWEDFFMGAMQGAGSAATSIVMGGLPAATVKKGALKGMEWFARRGSREAKQMIREGADPKKAAEHVLSKYKIGKYSVPDKAAGAVGAAIGFGGFGALSEGGGAAAEAEDAVARMASSDLNKIERFGEIYHQIVEADPNLQDLPVPQKHKIAHTLYAREQADRTFDDMALKGGLVATVAGPIMQRAMVGKSLNAGRGFAGGVVAEGVEEGFIGGETQMNVNIATDRPEDEGIAQARAEGAVRGGMGGGMASTPGAVISAYRNRNSKKDQDTTPAPEEQVQTVEPVAEQEQEQEQPSQQYVVSPFNGKFSIIDKQRGRLVDEFADQETAIQYADDLNSGGQRSSARFIPQQRENGWVVTDKETDSEVYVTEDDQLAKLYAQDLNRKAKGWQKGNPVGEAEGKTDKFVFDGEHIPAQQPPRMEPHQSPEPIDGAVAGRDIGPVATTGIEPFIYQGEHIAAEQPAETQSLPTEAIDGKVIVSGFAEISDRALKDPHTLPLFSQAIKAYRSGDIGKAAHDLKYLQGYFQQQADQQNLKVDGQEVELEVGPIEVLGPVEEHPAPEQQPTDMQIPPYDTPPLKIAEKKAETARESLKSLIGDSAPESVEITLPNGNKESGDRVMKLIEDLAAVGNDGSDVLGRMPAMLEQATIAPIQTEEVAMPESEEIEPLGAETIAPPEEVVAEDLKPFDQLQRRLKEYHAQGMTFDQVWDDVFKKSGNLADENPYKTFAYMSTDLSANGRSKGRKGLRELWEKLSTHTLEQHDKLISDLIEGNTTPESLRQGFKGLADSEEKIRAELQGMTKKQLLNRMGTMGRMRYKSEKKSRVVDAAYDSLMSDFALSSYSYGMDGPRPAIQKLVDGYTQDDLMGYADQVTQSRAEYQQKVEQADEAIKNPQSLEDYQLFIRNKGVDALTPEQKREIDRLQV